MKIAVIGGGASGLTAAIAAAEKHDVTVFEKQNRLGKKILVTGNGKCNVSNAEITRESFGRFYRNASYAEKMFQTYDYVFLKKQLEQLGLEIKTDATGRAYPYSESAESVADVLLTACKKRGVKQVLKGVKQILPQKNGFSVVTEEGKFNFDRVILAVGNVAGKREEFVDLLEGTHPYTSFVPSLVPLEVTPVLKQCDGVRVKAKVSLYDGKERRFAERGEVLFRKYGFSGIVVFNASSVWSGKATERLELDLFPDFSESELKQKLNYRFSVCGGSPRDLFRGLLHPKLTEALCTLQREKRIGNNLDEWTNLLKHWQFRITGPRSFSEAQVVRGGIRWDAIDENFQSKIWQGLYFCGEILDIDGLCGGFNLHFALSSGYYVGHSI